MEYEIVTNGTQEVQVLMIYTPCRVCACKRCRLATTNDEASLRTEQVAETYIYWRYLPKEDSIVLYTP